MPDPVGCWQGTDLGSNIGVDLPLPDSKALILNLCDDGAAYRFFVALTGFLYLR